MSHLKSALAISALLSVAQAVPVQGNTITGKIIDWPANLRGGEVRVTAYYSDLTAGTAPIDAEGNFKLLLADLSQKSDGLIKTNEMFKKEISYNEGCLGEGAAIPDTGYFQEFVAEVWLDGKPYSSITLDNSASRIVKKGDAEAILLYLSEAASLNGSVKCPVPYDNRVYQGQYPAGWSLVRAEMSPGQAGTTVYTDDPAAPLTGLSWRLFKEYGRAGLDLDYSTLQVKSVAEGFPAQKAGVKVGDVVVSVDGKPVLESGGLRGEPGSKLMLVVKRDGKEMTFEITRVYFRWPLQP